MSLRRFVARIGGIFHRKQIDSELNDEIQAHLEMEEADQRDAGTAAHGARPAAKRKFGNATLHHEDARDAWRFPSLESFLQDLRYAVRMLAKRPGFTAVVLLTLTLGIGATTAIFTVVDAVVLRPLPFRDPERIVEVFNYVPQSHLAYPGLGVDKIDQWRAVADCLETFEGYSTAQFVMTGESEPEQISAAYMTGGLMSFLGLGPRIGAGFSPEDGKPGRDHLVLLSQSFWLNRFGGDPGVVGRTITLNKESYTVVGVAPVSFKFPNEKVKLWVPIALTADSAGAKHVRAWVITRVKPQISIQQAQTRLDAISAQLAKAKARPGGWDVQLHALDSRRVQQKTRTTLFVLLGAVAFVLIIACVNTANLLLSQSTVREKEIAVRAALGAGPRRLVRQLLTESVLLSLVGGALGALLATWSIRLIAPLIPLEITFMKLNEIVVDKRILLFSFGLSTLTGIVFGLVPALKTARVNLNDSLSGGGRSNSGTGAERRLQNGLVVAQVALSLTLLIGAGLLLKSFSRLNGVANGFDSGNLLSLDMNLPASNYATGIQQNVFFEQAKSKLASVPGVRTVSFAGGDPLSDGGIDFGTLEAEGRPIADTDKDLVLPVTEVSSDYFASLGIPLLQGRQFVEQDGHDPSQPTIINQSMAKHLWPDGRVIGKRFRVGNSPEGWRTVVGIVGDVKEFDLDDKPERLEQYFPMPSGKTSAFRVLIVRTESDPTKFVPVIKSAIWSVDKDLPIQNIWTIDELMRRELAGPRFYSGAMTVFAAVAMLISMIGVYGVISYMVSRRTREISIRMALGAYPRNVLMMVIRQGLAPTSLGIALGIGGALELSKLLKSMLYEVAPTDALTYGFVSIAYILVALAACYIPARRAASVDPLVAFRSE
jgi:predicted permease